MKIETFDKKIVDEQTFGDDAKVFQWKLLKSSKDHSLTFPIFLNPTAF